MLKKFFSLLLIIQLLWLNTVPVFAQEVAPTPPSAPTSETITPPSAPSGPESSDPSSSLEPMPTATTSTDNAQSNSNNSNIASEQEAWEKQQEEAARAAYLAGQQYVVPVQDAPEYKAHFGGGNVGDTTIATGDANNGASVVTNANTNLASSPLNGGSASVLNTDNGASSSNNGSASIINDNNTAQNNTGAVLSGLTQSSVTGENNNSFNVGNSNIQTGDANTTGTVITALNTNVSGVMVSEFNIVDDHVGDIVLDFGANCIAGCGDGSLSLANTSNGASSTNTANANVTNNNNTFQNNDGTVGNQLVLSADSGNNNASYNTGGDSNITTGDANVAGNVLTFLNNNIAGNVVFSVINIFGDLIGDIIFPQGQFGCCGPILNASNTNNGVNSTNTAGASLTNNAATFQNNDATINNNLVFNAATGDNSASFNTGGNSTINTGKANVDANLLNIANNNILGGNMWLVLVNHAGNWIGKIIGAPEGADYAGSEGLEFSTGPSGEVLASNSGNGANSTNNAGTIIANTNNTTQNNTANVTNTLNLSANTGGNDTKFNTGGNSNIQTGNANIIANLVNFVNNNIVGNGKLFVTVINVFGSWVGDFVSPGQEKQNQELRSKNQELNTINSNSSNPSHSSSPSNPSVWNSPNNSNTPTLPNSSTTQTGTASSSFSLGNLGNNNSAGSASGLSNNLLASAKVAGISAHAPENSTQKMNINLAWLVILMLLALVFIVIRKLIMRLL